MTSPTLPYQIVWANTLAIGAGTAYDLVKLDGIDMPAVRRSDSVRPGDHGSYAGAADLYSSRIITAEIRIVGRPGADFAAKRDALRRACGITANELPWKLQLPGEPVLTCQAKCRGRKIGVDLTFSHGYATALLQWEATDPAAYSDEVHTLSGTVNGPALQVENAGDHRSQPIIRIPGPVTSPALTVGDRTLDFSGKEGLTVPSGSTLEVDLAAGTALVDGESRFGYRAPGSSWGELGPGTTPVSVTAASGTGSYSVEWRDAYSAWV